MSSIEIEELSFYCRKKAISIIIDYHNASKEEIKYYRYLYAGFMYGKKVANHIRRRNSSITNIDLYNHFKQQKQNSGHRAVDIALYDIMNFLNENF